MTSTQIEIYYRLYRETDQTPVTYDPVQAPADVALETALRESDTLQLVDSYGDVEVQIAALHAHVRSVPFEFPVGGHVIAFGHKTDTRWDPVTKTWVEVVLGGSISYPVVPENGDPLTADLHLEVWTKDAVGQS